MTIKDNEKMDEDLDDLFSRRDVRKKKESEKKKEREKDKKRTHKHSHEKDDPTREGFKKMRDELDELRKREAERTRELDELKKKIEEQERKKTNRDVQPEYEFEFRKEDYLNRGFIESAKWIKDELSKKLMERMLDVNNKKRFETILLSKRASSHLGARTCARFNRGEPCQQGKWHTTHRPDALWTRHGALQHAEDDVLERDQPGRRNEIRLHACTLCLEALGAAYGHSFLDCPWILKKNWEK